MAVCPACGSRQLKEVGPGEYRCQQVLGVHAARYELGGPPQYCGKRFFDPDFVGLGAATGTTCECGTYSVGKCTDCGLDVCGHHSLLIQDTRLCKGCEEARKSRAEDEAKRIRKPTIRLNEGQDRSRAIPSKPRQTRQSRKSTKANRRESRRIEDERAFGPGGYKAWRRKQVEGITLWEKVKKMIG